jgi:hypothetical protein
MKLTSGGDASPDTTGCNRSHIEDDLFRIHKTIISHSPGADPIKIFTVVIFEFSQYARVFVPGKPFQPSLMFVSKAKTYPIEAPFRCSPLS